jgi:hypothetical protein
MLGVFGTNEGLYNDPDGFFFHHPNPGCMNCSLKGRAACKCSGDPSRLSILTKQINKERGACFCQQCGRVVKYMEIFLHPPALSSALKTGNIDLVTNALAEKC